MRYSVPEKPAGRSQRMPSPLQLQDWPSAQGRSLHWLKPEQPTISRNKRSRKTFCFWTEAWGRPWILTNTYHLFLKPMILLPEWWKQLPEAALQGQKDNQNCDPSKTGYSYFHPEQGSHCDRLQWSCPQKVQEYGHLKRKKDAFLGQQKHKPSKDPAEKQPAWKKQTGTYTEMITVGFKPTKAKIQGSTPDEAIPEHRRAGFRDIQGTWLDYSIRRKISILSAPRPPNFLPSAPWYLTKACIMKPGRKLSLIHPQN